MLREFIKTYRWELGIALLALVIHFACFFVFVSLNNNDVLTTVRVDDGFYELAENVLAGNGFSWSSEAPYQPNTMRTPGYVWLLAGLIGMFGVTGAAVVQLIAATVIPILSMIIARLITGSRKIGIVTGMILALDPTLAQLSFQFYTETAFLILFLLWLQTTLHYFKRLTTHLLITSALLLGGAILIKASVQYIPFILIPCIFWAHGKINWRRSTLHSLLLIVVIAAIMAPWFIRNVQTFDTFGFSTQSTFVLYTNFAPAVITVAEKHNFLEFRDSFLSPEEYRGDAITFANQDTYKAKAIEIITDHPKETIYIMAKSMFTFFTNDGFHTLLKRVDQNPNDYFLFLVVMRLIWIGITLAAMLGACIYLFTKLSPQTVLVVALVAYLALVSTVAAFGTNPRYRLPVDPIILALAMVGGKMILMQLTGKYILLKQYFSN